MDEFRIDSHKLMFHVGRVNDWLNGALVYPIYMEISPVGSCNHRCTYCALDYMEYRPRRLDKDLLNKRLDEMSSLGLRSVMYAGEGEPLLHRDIGEIINHTKKAGMDVAVTSNGVLFGARLMEACLPSITWIKISINAGSKETYARVHGCREEDFSTVLRNVSAAVKRRASEGIPATIGMQMILLPENAHEALDLAKTAKEIGADYIVIKSYSQHPRSITRLYEGLKYGEYLHLRDELEGLSSYDFKVIFRVNAMKKLDDDGRGYERCLALPFWSYIDSGGGVWGCSAYLGDERFLFGNINDNTFEEIWSGAKRKKAMEFVANDLDTGECRRNCRMDEVNRYLWELKHPGRHVNFI
ncbi:MAG: radical SAM protein [Deltaproteobacteria bacterium]|nr:radical SAM protein [Deltaproteobacteria bacterium]MBI5902145.1 radical SAM protein [Deltaproteobacteria bacterium]